MFGFLRPTQPLPSYRAIYSRCCQHMRRQFGVRSLPFHSYESVFLYTCFSDAGKVPPELIEDQHCCRLRKRNFRTTPDELHLGRFAASTALTLADIKLADDIEDDQSRVAKLYRWVLKRPIRNARCQLEKYDSDIGDRIAEWLAEHAALEASGRPVPMAEYCIPTSEAFAHVFGLGGRVAADPQLEHQLRQVFSLLGRSLIAFDCAVDFAEDRRLARYNPIQQESDVAGRMAFLHRGWRSADHCV